MSFRAPFQHLPHLINMVLHWVEGEEVGDMEALTFKPVVEIREATNPLIPDLVDARTGATRHGIAIMKRDSGGGSIGMVQISTYHFVLQLAIGRGHRSSHIYIRSRCVAPAHQTRIPGSGQAPRPPPLFPGKATKQREAGNPGLAKAPFAPR